MPEVERENTGSREDTLRFLDMVSLFSTQAMMGLGKLANPATHKAERNLPFARLFIDTLEMLERKTKGNLTPDESKVLQSTLTDLRLMYVEESKAPAPKAESGTPPETKPEAGTATPPSVEDEKVKYHKSYGSDA